MISELKMLAVEQERTMQELLAESLNDLFDKYGKPEIALTDSKG
jgi:hypothetical protein